MKSLSRVRLLATPWTAAYQAPPSMGFSRQEYWSGLPLSGAVHGFLLLGELTLRFSLSFHPRISSLLFFLFFFSLSKDLFLTLRPKIYSIALLPERNGAVLSSPVLRMLAVGKLAPLQSSWNQSLLGGETQWRPLSGHSHQIGGQPWEGRGCVGLADH